MANYYLDVQPISRGKGHSVARRASYICGQDLYDSYNEKFYRTPRDDVIFRSIFLPDGVPDQFRDLQFFCNEINRGEKRYDARTAREFIGSLPSELPHQELKWIAGEYIFKNFTRQGLCAIAAIHERHSVDNPAKNNPHLHIIVSTRTIGPDGFSKKKDREHDRREYIAVWRESMADVQNRAYERNGLDIRVSHESLRAQGILDREPTIRLSLADYNRARNEERSRQRQLDRERSRDIERSHSR